MLVLFQSAIWRGYHRCYSFSHYCPSLARNPDQFVKGIHIEILRDLSGGGQEQVFTQCGEWEGSEKDFSWSQP